ncbi:MAG TPA: hypothetical protein PLY88_08405 [Candidatus Omnitrophota bacterium]|nr:hypothetical protein [Candidatus Omnitrophota bacterium]
MKPNYQGNKKRKEEQRRKKQEAKRLKRLNKGNEPLSNGAPMADDLPPPSVG